jgi:hypothetical protein
MKTLLRKCAFVMQQKPNVQKRNNKKCERYFCFFSKNHITWNLIHNWCLINVLDIVQIELGLLETVKVK